MSAIGPFRTTLTRVDGLVTAFGVLHGGGPGRPRQHAADVLRGAVVLAVAALDALVLDTVIEAVPALARKHASGPKVLEWIKQEPDRVLAGLAMDPIDMLEGIARDKLGRTTFQKAAAIEGNIREVTGMSLSWADAASRLWPAIKAEAFTKELDEFVVRRDRIAHAGDRPPGASAARPISKNYVVRGIALVRATGESVDAQIAAYIRSK